MNSAAVIGRQLRQQNTGRSGPGQPVTPGRVRPRASSHQQSNQKGEQGEKISRWEQFRSQVTPQCFWAVCKALSCGVFLLSAGMAMSVVGFYAEPLSTEAVNENNKTVRVLDQNRQYHLHNLTYVGPVIMGLGGFVLLAVCVMNCDGPETGGAKVVPIKNDKPLTNDIQLLDKSKLNGPGLTGPYLCVPGVPVQNNVVIPAPRPKCPTQQVTHPGPAVRPKLPLPIKDSPSSSDTKTWEVEVVDLVPSPQDLQLTDPDGCDTPRPSSVSSMDMELYLASCPITVRVQIEPRYLASMESLSDSDMSESAVLSCPLYREQGVPLLQQTSSPNSSPEHMEVPLLKRDTNRRLLGSSLHQSGRGLDAHMGDLFT
ncbi:uncharacterized protein LOC111630650 [Centruroides sculpturatus]|uniref:uncharacterized protein LOC111630650 n=1 Tax=Centruroides sculpturatus TaxID=218467 RepID=UPI000C6C8C9C|nr:uncharacterized protein LOC111630650 [Centruroides sculpturatus]